MTRKLFLTVVLVAVLSCAGTVNAVVFNFVTMRRGALCDGVLPDQAPGPGSDPSLREMMIKAKPVPQAPPPPIPKPKPQPKPKPAPTPIPTPAPTPKKPTTKPS